MTATPSIARQPVPLRHCLSSSLALSCSHFLHWGSCFQLLFWLCLKHSLKINQRRLERKRRFWVVTVMPLRRTRVPPASLSDRSVRQRHGGDASGVPCIRPGEEPELDKERTDPPWASFTDVSAKTAKPQQQATCEAPPHPPQQTKASSPLLHAHAKTPLLMLMDAKRV